MFQYKYYTPYGKMQLFFMSTEQWEQRDVSPCRPITQNSISLKCEVILAPESVLESEFLPSSTPNSVIGSLLLESLVPGPWVELSPTISLLIVPLALFSPRVAQAIVRVDMIKKITRSSFNIILDWFGGKLCSELRPLS